MNRQFSSMPNIPDAAKLCFPKVNETKLSSGTPLLSIQKQQLPITMLLLSYHAGAKYEPLEKSGLMQLFGRVVDEGAGPYDTFAFSDELDKLGSQIRFHASRDHLFATCISLTEHAEKTFELLQYIFTEPRFAEDIFQLEKQQLLVFHKQRIDMPDLTADLLMQRYVYGAENTYGRPMSGWEKTISRIEHDDIKHAYYNLFLPHPHGVHIVSDKPASDFTSFIERISSFTGNSAPLPEGNFSQNILPRTFYVSHKENAEQTEIRLGHAFPKQTFDNMFANRTFHYVFGGNFNSRLNKNLRERLGLTYGASSGLQVLSENTSFIISTAVDTNKTGVALQEIFRELEGVKSGITEEECSEARRALSLQLPLKLESYSHLVSFLSEKSILGLPDDYLQTYAADFLKICTDDVQKLTIEYLHPEAMQVILVGDKAVIQSSVKELFGADCIEVDIDGNMVK